MPVPVERTGPSTIIVSSIYSAIPIQDLRHLSASISWILREHLRFEIIIFDPENTRFSLADIAGINSISRAILERLGY
jgi:hypothetical protein